MHALATMARTVAVAFSMFSAIPMPQFVWDDDSLRYMLVAFPLVGAVIGALACGWAVLCAHIAVPVAVQALVLTALPLIVTGGIHLDGFCDTWDAMASRQDPERMRQILKDPHMGAFGAMHLAMLLLATFVLWQEVAAAGAVQSASMLPIVLGYMLSRSLAGFSVAAFPLAEGDGLARSFARAADRKRVRLGCAALGVATALAIVALGEWPVALAAGITCVWYRLLIVKRFAGLSGDLCGWFVQASEVWMLAAFCATHVLEVIV